MLGQLLDKRYQVSRVLGAGGFGQTYIAQDTRIPGHPTCVVKHLKPASSDPKFLEVARRLFHSEAETLAKLGSHDQIPRLLAQFEENQEFFLVQEYIDGHPLSAELQLGQRLSEPQVMQLLSEVLNALVFVHSQGVIHRDIKPDNIIRRTSDNKLVLIDFGAIKQVRTQLVTSHGQVSATVAIGTPGYMPTEQGQGKPRPNSDIYALGMIGIQAVTGMYPNQLQEDITTGEVIWQHQAQISPGLADVLTKMTRYHFKDRYQSATEALQALHQLANPYASPPTPGYTPTDYATQPAANPGYYTPPQPTPTPPQPRTEPSWEQTNPVAPPNPFNAPGRTPVSQPTGSGTSNRLPLLVGLGVAALISVVSGLVFIQVQMAQRGPSSNITGQASPGSTDDASSTLAKAREAATSKDKGGIPEAIEIAKTIPSNNPAYQEAQDAIAQWQKEHQEHENLFAQFNQAYEQGRWQEVVDLGWKIPQNSYWNDKVTPKWKEAKNQTEAKAATNRPKTTKPSEKQPSIRETPGDPARNPSGIQVTPGDPAGNPSGIQVTPGDPAGNPSSIQVTPGDPAGKQPNNQVTPGEPTSPTTEDAGGREACESVGGTWKRGHGCDREF